MKKYETLKHNHHELIKCANALREERDNERKKIDRLVKVIKGMFYAEPSTWRTRTYNRALKEVLEKIDEMKK